MTVKLRMARGGSKKRPFYRIVAADERAPRDGRYIEKLGFHNPLLPKEHAQRSRINDERIRYWLGVGAKPSDRLRRLLAEHGLMERAPIREQTKQHLPKAKTQERLQAAEQAKSAPPPEPSAEAPAETSDNEEPSLDDSSPAEAAESSDSESPAEAPAETSDNEEATPVIEETAEAPAEAPTETPDNEEATPAAEPTEPSDSEDSTAS